LNNGLLSIVEEITHCDLKFENVMFKRISKEEAVSLESKGLFRLEFFPDEYYQLKIIDFGLAVSGDRASRKCIGGSSEYAAFDYLISTPKDSVDVYAMAVIMMSTEMLQLGFPLYAKMNKITFFLLQNWDVDEDDLRAFFEGGFNTLFYTIWEISTDKSIFIQKLKERVPDLDEFFQVYFDNMEVKDVPYQDFIFSRWDIFHAAMISALEIFWNDHYKETCLDEELEKVDSMILNQQKEIESIPKDQKEEIKKSTDMLQYFQSQRRLKEAEGVRLIEYMNYVISILGNHEAYRPSKENLRDFLKGFKETLEKENLDDLSFINVFKRNYAQKMSVNGGKTYETVSIDTYEQINKQMSSSFKLDRGFRVIL
jgi:serine/threonine protein kinase